MSWVRGLRKKVDLFDLLSLGLIAVITLIALAYWSKFPVHMDTFYHMGVTGGYSSAGGVALHSFWEYAPVGRAQLYPPLLHIFMFALTKTGLSMLSVGRIVAFFGFPLIALSSWYGMRTLFNKKASFYTTVVLSSCYLLFWHSAVESAAAFVLILAPLIFVAVERDRKVAAALLLALALYSHLVLGHLLAFGLLIYAIHRRKQFKEILIVLVGAYLAWLPWGIHVLVNLKSITISDPMGGTSSGITLHLLVWAVALAGFVYCYFKKGKYYLLPAFLLGIIPIAFFYPDRFWNAHGFVPLAMLGGVALAGAHEFAGRKFGALIKSRNAYRVVMATVVAVPVVVLLLLDPVYATGRTAGGPSGRPLGQVSVTGAAYSSDQGQITSAASSGLSAQSSPPAANGATGSAPPAPPAGQKAPPAGFPGPPGTPSGTQGVPGQQGPAMMPPGGPMGGAGGMSSSSSLSLNPTTLISLVNKSGGMGQQSLSSATLINADTLKLAQIIKTNSTSDAIVSVSDGSLGNLITGLTGRASTGGMFHEVSPSQGYSSSSANNASLLVVSSGGQGMAGGPGQGQATSTVDTSKYKLVGTAGSYSVYKNTSATATASNHGTVIPWFVIFPLIGLALIAIGVDWFRPGPKHPFDDEDKDRDGSSSDGGKSPDAVCEPQEGDGGGGLHPSVLAIVPCYNERSNIRAVVTELRTVAPLVDVLVVDDGSTDGSGQVARDAGAIVVSHPRNMGIGAAVRTGMSYALEAGYDYAVQVDGDGQHDPRGISSLLGPLEDGTADVVVGSRFLGVGDYEPPLARRFGISLLARVVSAAVGHRATDTTSGFRAMNRRALAFLVANYPDDYPESESLVLMDKGGVAWTEAPVSMRSRANGVSSIHGISSAYYMAKVLGCIALDASGLKSPRPSAYEPSFP
jgi:hypothetical protein